MTSIFLARTSRVGYVSRRLYRLLDRVLRTGEPIEIDRGGKKLLIVPKEKLDRLNSLVRRKGHRGDQEDLVHLDCPRSGEVIYLDTHVVVWLYAGEHNRFPKTARRLIEAEPLLISPVLLLELALLEETGRIRARAHTMFAELQELLALSLCDLPFAEVSIASLEQKWTRDPFDRLIVLKRLHRAPD